MIESHHDDDAVTGTPGIFLCQAGIAIENFFLGGAVIGMAILMCAVF